MSATPFLNKLVFSSNLIPELWRSLRSSTHFESLCSRDYDDMAVPLSLLCHAFSHLLKVQDDHEFYVEQSTFKLSEVVSKALFNDIQMYYSRFS